MKYNFHTDLAIETREEYQRINQSDIPGIDVDNETVDDVKITRVKVTSDEGAEAIGKAMGNYITLEVSKISEDEPDKNDNISNYMKTSIKTLKRYLPYIKNTLSNNYHNGFVEGNNNFIKVLKRIAFGFRSFYRFKARIMICKNLLHMKRANAI